MGVTPLLLRLAAVLVVAAVAFKIFASEHTKDVVHYEMTTLALMPIFQLGWKSGYLAKAARRPFDDTGYKYVRIFFSQEYFDESIKKFKAQPDHVYVVTFPKSGTHLTGQLVTQVISEGKAEFDTIHEYVAGLEFEAKRTGPTPCPTEILGLDNIDDFSKASRKVILTHMAHVHVPYSPEAKYIVVMRNPLDIMLSLRSMIGKKLGPRLIFDWDSLFEIAFADDDMGYAMYYAHWWKLSRKVDNVLFLFYEDALKNMSQTIVDVTEFLGQEVDPDTVERVRYLSSIEYMKPNSDRFEPPDCMMKSVMLPKDPRSRFDMVNKGKAGRGKKAVPDHLKGKIKENFLAAFKDTDFPIERYSTKIE